MPGAYAHLTMVTLLGSPNGLAGLGGLDKKTLAPLLSYSKYTELGAVSPDYPYLDLGNKSSAGWADAMHYERTGDRLKQGLKHVGILAGEEKYKVLAWLLGFASHIATDITIHPAVELKVGPYAQNAKAHRTCEMHQDVFIYKLLKVGEIYRGNFIHDGIAACSDPAAPRKLDPVIASAWDAMLRQTDDARHAATPPLFHHWHSSFQAMLSTAGSGKFLPLTRHMLAGQGVTYPRKPEAEYIRQLRVPGGGHMDYEHIFARAQENVKKMWDLMLRYCLAEEKPDLSILRNWNLDTGRDESGKITMWE